MNDGIISIDTVLNVDDFDAQYYELEFKLDQLTEEYKDLSQMKPFEGQPEELNSIATQIQKCVKQLDKMKQKTKEVKEETQEVNQETIEYSNNTSKGFSKGVKSIKSFALGLIGLRSAYSLAQRASSAYLSQDTELSNKLSSIWFGLGAFLKPLLEWVANAMAKLVGYINVFVKALTGRDFIQEANNRVKAINKQTKAQEKLNKTTASFDEVNVLSSNKNKKQDEDNIGFDVPELNENVVKKLQDLAQVLKDNKDKIKEFGKFLLDVFVGATALKVLGGIGKLLGVGGTSGSGLLGILGVLTFIVSAKMFSDLYNLLARIDEVSDAMVSVRSEFYSDPNQSWEGKANTQKVNAAAIRRGEASLEQKKNNVKTSKQLVQAGVEELKNTELTAEKRQEILDIMNDQISLNWDEIDALEEAGQDTKELQQIEAELRAMRRQAMIDLGGEYAEIIKREDELERKIQGTVTGVFKGLNYLTDTKRVGNDIKDTFNNIKDGAGNIATNVGNLITKFKGVKQEAKETQQNVDGINSSSSKSTSIFDTLKQKVGSMRDATATTKSWLDIINSYKINDKSFKVNADTKSAQDKLKDLMFGWMPEKTKKLLRGWGFTFLAKGGIVHQPGSGVPIGSNIIAGEGRDAEAVLPLNDVTLGALGEQISKYITANFVVNNYMDNRKINSIQTTAQNRTDIMRNGG